MCDFRKLPFFPKYATKYLEQCPYPIRINFFEQKFSQNFYNYENVLQSSNACTLIAVLMAAYVKQEKLEIGSPEEELEIQLVYLLAYSLLDGNKIHENLKKRGNLLNYNLTVPEAINFAGRRADGLSEWKSLVYMESMLKTLHVNLKSELKEWYKKSNNKNRNNLFIILIADNRSVLFIVQSDMVALVDSHQHSENKGALLAVSALQNINVLCLWYNHHLIKCYQYDTELYELSFLYFRK